VQILRTGGNFTYWPHSKTCGFARACITAKVQ